MLCDRTTVTQISSLLKSRKRIQRVHTAKMEALQSGQERWTSSHGSMHATWNSC